VTTDLTDLRVGIVGAGTMGSGIAQVALLAGHTVTLVDVQPEVVARGRVAITAGVQRLVDKGQLASDAAAGAMARLRSAGDLEDLASAGLVIEAAPEKLALKQALFGQLSAICPAAILASNTSSLRIADIAADAGDPAFVVGMHFFNPAPIMPLVEVIRGPESSPDAVALVTAAARAWGKTPVLAADMPGFIVNRVARPYYLEALRIAGEGLVTVSEVDWAMEAAGFRMGPFRLLDLIGIDVNYDVSQAVYAAFDRHPRFAPHPIQAEMVARGQLGRKTGRGFYDYRDATPAEEIVRATPLEPAQATAVQLRILACIINEAYYALGEGVATAADIDTAMRLGTNYPQGPLAWGDALGLEVVRSALRGLQAMNPERYALAPRLDADS
jgi:3-hydroxybutyryl-CoA dehydrogenase